MDFIEHLADYGDAPEFYVSGVGRVTRVSSTAVRIALYVNREQNEGEIERRLVVNLLCDLEDLTAAQALFVETITTLEKATPLNSRSGPGQRAPVH